MLLKVAQKVPKYLEHFCKKIWCHQLFLSPNLISLIGNIILMTACEVYLPRSK